MGLFIWRKHQALSSPTQAKNAKILTRKTLKRIGSLFLNFLLVKGREELRRERNVKCHCIETSVIVETCSDHNTEDRVLFQYVVLDTLPRGKLTPCIGQSSSMLYV